MIFMNVIIIEDESLASERLKLLLKKYDPSIKVLASVESIEDTVQWLKTNPHPDLLLMDIQLADGHSFEIFKQVTINKPVIFTTAYDNYAIHAFHYYSIDYILKPVTAETLATAIRKFEMMTHPVNLPDYKAWANKLREEGLSRYKDRFLAKVGQRTFFIQTDDIAFFYADNKTTYLVDKSNNKFIIHYNIESLDNLLDPYYFFRINRKIIVHSKLIDMAKPYLNNRIKLILKDFKNEHEFIVSRDRVPQFRKWAEGEYSNHIKSENK